MRQQTNIETQFFELIENNKDRINRICSVYAKNSEDQKDLVQDVFLNIWKALPSFEQRSSIHTWVYRITLNVCMRSKYEKLQRSKVNLDSIKIEYPSEEPKEAKYEQLYQCIAQLAESDRSLIVLFLEDLPYKEIAQILGISENYVAVKIKRIKAQLLNCLNAQKDA